MIPPLDFPEIFNIFRIRVFVSRIQKEFSVKLKTIVIQNCLMQHKILCKKTIVYESLQYGIKEKSLKFVIYDLES